MRRPANGASPLERAAAAPDRLSSLATVSGVLEQPAVRRRSRAAWVVILALAVGVGLISMHTGAPSSAHAHSSGHAAAVVAMDAGDASHGSSCKGCASHSSMAAVCAVLLVAVASGVAARVARRLAVLARVVHVAPAAALCWVRTSMCAVARAPNLHALQVMRC